MSVTVLNEIEKAEVLIEGLKKHLDEVKEIGIGADDLKELEAMHQALRAKDEETDKLRQQLNVLGREKNRMLAEMKAQMLVYRKAVKQRYSQPEWLKYGVQDKR